MAIRLQQSLLHREFWVQLFIGRLLPVAIPFFAWSAIFDYTQANEMQGWGRHEMAAYYLLIFFISLFADIDFHYEMSQMIHLGTLDQWLIRPLSFLETTLSFILAKVVILLIPGGAAILLGLWFIPNLSAVTIPMVFTAIAVLPLSLGIFALLSTAIAMLSFWIVRTDSTFTLIMLILEFLGGRLLPLSFLPDWLESMSYFFPLRFALSLPAEAILLSSTMSLPLLLFGQALWCVLLVFLSVLLWRSGIRHYDAVGG